MSRPRNKNIPREIRDIRFPTSHVPDKSPASEIPVRKVGAMPVPRRRPLPVARRRRFPMWPIAAFACLAVMTAAATGFAWYRHKAEQAVQIQPVPAGDLSAPVAGWVSLIKDAFSSLVGLEKSSLQVISSLGNIGALVDGIPGKFLAGDGSGVIADLTTLSSNLGSLIGSLENAGSSGGGSSSGSVLSGLSRYAAYVPDLERARTAVDRLLALLESPGEHHLLVLFGNSAELRPGGGFLGSFADMAFGDSAIEEITVHDINEVDRGFAANIVPPKPMQGIATRWRAADANWFFDYPESARKTLEFMGRSSFYASSTLEGAILISPRVIQDLLTVTGPIVLNDGGTSVSADTIIPMIQREVQAGQASGAENPKEILSRLLSPLESKLQELDAAALAKLSDLARNWIHNKDVAIFMRDPELAKVISYYEADGGSYVIPGRFSGDYFAAVNANLGGGKSDARISDTIDLESDLRVDGVIENRVVVIRESSADSSDEWWYRVTNQNYLQAFTPSGVTLTAATGGRSRSIAARADYSRGFETDPDLARLESTLRPVPGFLAISQFRESDKNVFATWLTTPPGGSAAARFEYRRDLGLPFRDGSGYTFVFERQSGAHQSLRVILNAPPGFVWEESDVSKYEYFNESVPGRVILNLTLQAI